MSVTNLIGYTWICGVTSSSHFGNLQSNSINYTYNGNNYTDLLYNDNSSSSYTSGFMVDPTPTIIHSGERIVITGGSAVANPTLIELLEANGTLVAPEPSVVEKNILLHPIVNGQQDTNTNLYPKTKKTNIIDVEDLENKIESVVGSTGVGALISVTTTNKVALVKGTTKLEEAINTVENLPTIPTKTSDLTNDSGFITNSALDDYQEKLVSGSNIKTINGNSILGSGDIEISGGGGVDIINPLPTPSASSPNMVISGGKVYFKNIYYSITYNLSNHVGGYNTNPLQLDLGTSGQAQFDATSGYTLPGTITVTNATYTWTKSTENHGVLVISNPTGNVTVTIAGLEKFTTPTITLDGNTLSTDIVEGVTKYKIYDNGSYIGYVDSNNVWHGEVSE